MSNKIVEGTCRSCGCTEDKACTLSVLSGNRCSEVLTPTQMRWTCQWVDDARTRCSACFTSFHAYPVDALWVLRPVFFFLVCIGSSSSI